MDILTLGVFVLILILCLVLDWPIYYALLAGLVLFLAYGRYKGLSWSVLLASCLEGLRTTKTIFLFFILIGAMVGLWRACGTIPVILAYASTFVQPSVCLLLCFWLCCGISFLLGSSFASAGTMGVVCMILANSMQVDPFWTGGAILSGLYFGDRCSPVSSSAQLVAVVTGTEIYTNIRYMFKDAWIPFLASSVIYFCVGQLGSASRGSVNIAALFAQSFALDPLCFLPAVLILGFAALRLNVKLALFASIMAAMGLAFWVQGLSWGEIASAALWGYETKNAALAKMMNGGGIYSMLYATVIVGISACYAGLFKVTALLEGLKKWIEVLACRTTKFTAVALTGMIMGAVSCNQTFSTILTQQLCEDVQPDKQQLARDMENTLIPAVALIPWCIAGAVPLSIVGAPANAVLVACYLYLLPLWQGYVTRKL